MSLTLVDAGSDADGFDYPYYLHTPEDTGLVAGRTDVPVLVEPAGVPRPTDDFESVLDAARRTAEDGFGRRVADELGVPFLLAVFPRPERDPVDWTHYTTSLDRETLTIDGGPLERIDLQLLAMVDDARTRLADRGVSTRDRVSLNGFSATGSFVNRFAALHPERVLSVTAGGLNGMAILPVEAADPAVAAVTGGVLPYPVGIGDVESLTGEPVDRSAFRDVPQFLYLGGEDDNDTLLYPDAWTGPAERLAAVRTYGEDVHEERFPHCQAVYDDVDAATVFRVYDEVGHTPEPALADVVAFHERTFAGADVADLRTDLGGNVQ